MSHGAQPGEWGVTDVTAWIFAFSLMAVHIRSLALSIITRSLYLWIDSKLNQTLNQKSIKSKLNQTWLESNMNQKWINDESNHALESNWNRKHALGRKIVCIYIYIYIYTYMYMNILRLRWSYNNCVVVWIYVWVSVWVYVWGAAAKFECKYAGTFSITTYN